MTSPGVRFSMSASASSVRASMGANRSWVASDKAGDGSAPLCSASKVFMTAPNSAAVFLSTFSVAAGMVSRALLLEGRVEMSMGVRFMVFTLQRVFEGRVAVAGQRQKMAADQLLVS